MRDAENRPHSLALVVGIDEYPFVNANPLQGCRNDAERISALLADSFGFQVQTLIDHEATRDHLVRALGLLLRQAKPESRIVFHFSGHGSQIKNTNGDTLETLVPHDSGRGEYPNRDITDREIYGWLRRISEITPFVTLIFDSCHAGGIVRDLEAPVRSIALDERSESVLEKSAFIDQQGSDSQQKDALRDTRPKKGPAETDRYSLLAACQASERARELKDPATNIHHGAFSYLLCEEIAKHCTHKGEASLSNRDLLESIAARMSLRTQGQTPKVEGAWDRELFGAQNLPAMRFVLVEKRIGNSEIQLKAGAAHGLILGSSWEIYPAGTRRRVTEEALGKVQVHEVTQVRAAATVLHELAPNAIESGCRAVECDRPASVRRLSVRIWNQDPSGNNTTKLAEHLDTSLLLDRAETTEPTDFVAYRLLPRDSVKASSSLFPGLGGFARPVWIVTDNSGHQVMPPRMESDETIGRLISNLETLARARALVELENPAPDAYLAEDLQIEIWRREPLRAWHRVPASSQHLEFLEGDCVGFNLNNSGDVPLHVSILNIGLTGSIQQLHPVRGASDPIRPFQAKSVGIKPGHEIELFIPKELPFPGESFEQGLEHFIFIATTEESDMELLAQPGVRQTLFGNSQSSKSEAPEAKSALAGLLQTVVSGLPERDARYRVTTSEPGRWTIQRRSVWLRRV